MTHVVTFILSPVLLVPDHVVSGRASRSSVSGQSGASRLQHLNVDERLVYSILASLSMPIPDHITPYPHHRSSILPARLLLHFFDKKQGCFLAKIHHVDAQTVNVDGYDRVVTASLATTTNSELRMFVQAAGIFNPAKLRKPGLVAALLSGDYLMATAERAKSAIACTRLEKRLSMLEKEHEEELSSLRDQAREHELQMSLQTKQLKALRTRLTIADHQAEQNTFRRKTKGRDETVIVQAAVLVKHPYKTRLSLNTSNILQVADK